MRLREIALRGLTSFTAPEPVRIRLDDLGDGLIALVGVNGAGKTTLLEAPAAALYKTLPSRPGSLYEHAHGRDAFVEAVWENAGGSLTTRVQMDAERRTAESYIFADGQSLTTGRAAEFEAEVERRFGSYALFLSSVFAAQNRAGNFLLMKRGERKGLFVELLGLGRLEVLAAAARDRATGAERDVVGLRASMADVERDLLVLPEMEQAAVSWGQDSDVAAEALRDARADEQRAGEALARIEGAAERIRALEHAETSAQKLLAAAERDLMAAQARWDQAERAYERGKLLLDGRNAAVLEPQARQRHATATANLDARAQKAESLLARLPRIEAAEREIARVRTRSAEIQAITGRQAQTLAASTLSTSRRESAERALGTAMLARAGVVADLRTRAGLIGEAPCAREPRWTPLISGPGSTDEDLAGACPLLADARTARERLETLTAPEEEPCPEEREALGLARIEEERTRADLLALEGQLPGLLAEASGLQEELDGFQPIAQQRLFLADAERTIAVVAAERRALDQALGSDVEGARWAVEQEASERRQLDVTHRDELAAADEAIATARRALPDARTRHETASAELRQAQGQLAGVDLSTAKEHVATACSQREHAEQEDRRCVEQLARLQARLDQLRARRAELEDLRERLSDAEARLGDWNLLAQALGRDGVQALEIDAAGPEVAALTNDLLEACYGPRFSITFETLREKRSVRGEYSEVFDVRVFDGGAERAVEALSGGEKVIVGESLSLALAIHNARKSGIRWETLWRDETAGALDPENASAYIQMLRRALRLGGFRQCLFVAHLPAVYEAADVQIHVAGGAVTVGTACH